MELNKGDKITYTKHYMFGKKSEVTAKVVAVKGYTALLDNGDEITSIYNDDTLIK